MVVKNAVQLCIEVAQRLGQNQYVWLYVASAHSPARGSAFFLEDSGERNGEGREEGRGKNDSYEEGRGVVT